VRRVACGSVTAHDEGLSKGQASAARRCTMLHMGRLYFTWLLSTCTMLHSTRLP
jgi:hypothetical protein